MSSFAQDNGYTPTTFDDFMGAIRVAINEQFGTAFDATTFLATNWYKYFYTLVQMAMQNETKTAEIFAKLQQYITTTNLRIQRPSVSQPGLIDSFESRGYTASVKKNLLADAGTVSICIDTDELAADYPATRLILCGLVKDYVAGGMVSQGTEVESITLTNGQAFDFKFYLPTRTAVKLRLTLTSSENQLVTLPDDETIRQTLIDNIKARYRLGWDFEPQRYYTLAEAPWAATILLEWSYDGITWHSTVFLAAFTDLFTVTLEDTTILVDP